MNELNKICKRTIIQGMEKINDLGDYIINNEEQYQRYLERIKNGRNTKRRLNTTTKRITT